MGLEMRCAATLDGRRSWGTLLLETDALIFRGEPRATLRFADLTEIRSSRGVLHVTFSGGHAQFELGRAADTWAKKILFPKSRIDKFGVKPGSRVAVIDIDDDDFLRELTAVTPHVTRRGRQRENDLIFVGAVSKKSLEWLSSLKSRLKKAGALWVIRPKGHKEITEARVMAAGKAAGFVDVKVVKFSETHTAEKFVIPVKARA